MYNNAILTGRDLRAGSFRLSGFMLPKFPAVLGFDGAGVVDTVGANVQDLKVGDEVLASFVAGDDRAAAYQVPPSSQVTLKQDFNACKRNSLPSKPPMLP